MPQVHAAGSGGIRLELDAEESELLRRLINEMRILIEADIPRQDAVVQRLFPDAYDSVEEADAFRDMVDGELRAAKLDALRTVEARLGGESGTEETIAADEITAWLTLLTDMRLAIGTRLDVTEESMAAEIDPDDPDGPAYTVMHWLGWIQESILKEMR